MERRVYYWSVGGKNLPPTRKLKSLQGKVTAQIVEG